MHKRRRLMGKRIRLLNCTRTRGFSPQLLSSRSTRHDGTGKGPELREHARDSAAQRLVVGGHRLMEGRRRCERLKNDAAIESALRERDESRSASRESEADRLPPPLKNTDWIPPAVARRSADTRSGDIPARWPMPCHQRTA